MVAQSVLLSAVAGLAAIPGAAAGNDTITSDAYFYGQSPPVYPSPDMTGVGEWAVAFNKARGLVAQMTLEEKINITTGVAPKSGCSGVIPPIERLGFYGMCLSDNGNGLRATDFVSSFPSGVHAGASWNKELTRQRGAAMGNEFKKKGVNVLLGPVVGPAWRTVLSGRNWEGFAADPYLSGALAAQTVMGTQGSGVITSTKHFIGNEQETNRNPSSGVEALSSNIDDKTMHELYLWPFQDAVKAGSGNIMCSYQRVNNSYGCANSKTMNGLLKTELGFQGFVVTDWGALHAGKAAILAGLDMAMPNAGSFWGDELVKSVKNGSVPESRITDMATRILTPWYQLKQDEEFKEPGHGMPKDVMRPHKIVDGRDPAAKPILLSGAIEGHVLVKNTKSTLPLRQPKMLSVFGYSAKTPDAFTSPISWMIGAQPIDINEAVTGALGTAGNYSAIGINGTLFGGCGSGATTPANMVSPFEALKARTNKDGTALSNDLTSAQPTAFSASDACIVFANAWACEGYDRPELEDKYSDALIKSVAGSCNKTIVVFHNAGTRLVDGFIEHPNVTAVIFAHLPGQESGDAIVSLLYGDSNPSGKLPYTVAKNASDYGSLLEPAQPQGNYTNFPQADFDEGVYTDYRRFDKEDIEPRYEFGFGMSYTTFNISNLHVVECIHGANTDEWPTGAVITGGQADLWDSIASVTVDVTNTGDVAGAEVAQLYMGIPDAPAKQLRGFEKVYLEKGEKKSVTMTLTRRDLSVWNVEKQKWQLQKGEYKIYVGNSSRNLPMKATMNVRP